jgi:hypothetical protein
MVKWISLVPPDQLARYADRAAAQAPFTPHDFGDELADSPEIAAEIDRRAFHRTAEVLLEVGRALCGFSTHSAAVAHALGLNAQDESGSLAAIGARLGVSKQAVAKRIVALRENFSTELYGPARQPKLRRPTIPGRWLTRPELRREFLMEAQTATNLGCRTAREEKGNHLFWDGDDLRRLLNERAERDAARRWEDTQRKQRWDTLPETENLKPDKK